jgi:hypothetical protein
MRTFEICCSTLYHQQPCHPRVYNTPRCFNITPNIHYNDLPKQQKQNPVNDAAHGKSRLIVFPVVACVPPAWYVAYFPDAAAASGNSRLIVLRMVIAVDSFAMDIQYIMYSVFVTYSTVCIVFLFTSTTTGHTVHYVQCFCYIQYIMYSVFVYHFYFMFVLVR